MSQLDLAIAAGVSSRHVSFLETGRAQPSREMVLRLGATLDVPLRDQNEMLRAADFADAFPEPDVQGGLTAPVAMAIDRMFAAHEPLPIVLLDRRYDVLRTNAGAARVLGRFVVDPSTLTGRINMFALLFDPKMARPFVVDWEHVARGLVARLHRESLTGRSDPALAELLRSLFDYPDVPAAWRHPDFTAPSEPVVTLRVRKDDLELAFLTTLTSFSAPGNVTLDELRIESYFPLDEATERACGELA